MNARGSIATMLFSMGLICSCSSLTTAPDNAKNMEISQKDQDVDDTTTDEPEEQGFMLGLDILNNIFDILPVDLSTVVSTAKSVKDVVTDVTEEQEILLGQGIVSNLLGIAPLLADPPIQQYVNRVGRWVSMQTERPDLPWTFAVIDDQDINAFAAPGGYIVITKGLLMQMRNEAELAGVLAHEIAHVLQKHHLHALKNSAGMNIMANTLGAVLKTKGITPGISKLALAGTELYTRGLDKDDEFEADSMGIVIAARAGYDPYGLPAVLQTLQTINDQDSGLLLMLKTHPRLTDRLEALSQIMDPSFEQFENQANLANRFSSFINTKHD